MRTIMLLNAKGGCGKSTLATNLASYYATQEKSVVIADFDPQGSALEWLATRRTARDHGHRGLERSGARPAHDRLHDPRRARRLPRRGAHRARAPRADG